RIAAMNSLYVAQLLPIADWHYFYRPWRAARTGSWLRSGASRSRLNFRADALRPHRLRRLVDLARVPGYRRDMSPMTSPERDPSHTLVFQEIDSWRNLFSDMRVCD